MKNYLVISLYTAWAARRRLLYIAGRLPLLLDPTTFRLR